MGSYFGGNIKEIAMIKIINISKIQKSFQARTGTLSSKDLQVIEQINRYYLNNNAAPTVYTNLENIYELNKLHNAVSPKISNKTKNLDNPTYKGNRPIDDKAKIEITFNFNQSEIENREDKLKAVNLLKEKYQAEIPFFPQTADIRGTTNETDIVGLFEGAKDKTSHSKLTDDEKNLALNIRLALQRSMSAIEFFEVAGINNNAEKQEIEKVFQSQELQDLRINSPEYNFQVMKIAEENGLINLSEGKMNSEYINLIPQIADEEKRVAISGEIKYTRPKIYYNFPEGQNMMLDSDPRFPKIKEENDLKNFEVLHELNETIKTLNPNGESRYPNIYINYDPKSNSLIKNTSSGSIDTNLNPNANPNENGIDIESLVKLGRNLGDLKPDDPEVEGKKASSPSYVGAVAPQDLENSGRFT